MPAPAYPIPSSPSPVQLYRHLLRECSYLPPAFRATIAATIQDRFHRHRENDPRAKSHLSRALSALRTLRAANSGDKAAMEGLILKGFGRTGSRRRELMAQFVVPQGPNDSQALEALLDAAEGTVASAENPTENSAENPAESTRKLKKAFFEKWDQPKLLQALQSQRQQQKDSKGTASWPGTSIKSINPDQFVPKENIWGKPPVESLIRAKRVHWWRRNAGKIMPPLGKGEWDILQLLSMGGQREGEWMVPDRRIHVKPLTGDAETTRMDWSWEEYATKPIAVVERPKSLTQQRRTGQKDESPYGVGERDRDLSARWFRRAYNRTWQLTPTMTQDPNALRYSFSWGSIRSRLPPASKHQLEIFEGVNDKRGQTSRKTPSR